MEGEESGGKAESGSDKTCESCSGSSCGGCGGCKSCGSCTCSIGDADSSSGDEAKETIEVPAS
jgi:hypothetical protein